MAIALNKVLTLRNDQVPIEAGIDYQVAGLQSYAKGLFVRGIINGSGTKYKNFNRLHVGQIILSRIKGWEGALALVSSQFDGMLVPPHNECFDVLPDHNPAFIWACLKQPAVWSELNRNSKGMGARRDTVSLDTFLGLKIPEYKKSEQETIAALFFESSSLLEELSGLVNTLERDRNALFSRCLNAVP